MTGQAFDGAYAKLERAKGLARDLGEEFRWFLDANQPRVVQEFDEATGDLVYRSRQVVATPLRFGIRVGEVVHHLRSSFDHAVWQLVIANGGTPGRQHQFPVCADSAMYQAEAARTIKGVSERAAHIIERLQPYQSGTRYRNHCMWFIHDLDRIDKHRILLVAVAAAFVWGVKYDTSEAEFETYGGVRMIHLREGAELLRIKKDELKPGLKAYPQTTYDIALEETGTSSLLSAQSLLIHLIDFTAKALKQLELPAGS